MKKSEQIFPILVLIILALTSIYSLFVKDQEMISYVENRNLKTNQDLNPRELLNGVFESTIETILTDQFYDRYEFVKLKNKINYANANILYSLIDDPMVLNPVGETYVNQIGSSQLLMSNPIAYSDIINQRIIDRAGQINKIAEDYPNVGFYVYKPTQIQEKDFFDSANGLSSGGDRFEESLRTSLQVPYSSFKIDDLNDYEKYFYSTDHHWNHRGSYQGYLDILNLIEGNKDDALSPLAENCKDGLKFYGTYSAQSGFVNDGADFCVYKFDLPEYVAYSDGQLNENPNDTNRFFDRTGIDTMDYHYNKAYGLGNGFVHLENQADIEGDLLIIGDSYAGPVLPLLLNHYKNIYFVYPINYKGIFKVEFKYDSFIKEKNIDKVLFMYTIENYFLSDEWGDRYLDFDVKRD